MHSEYVRHAFINGLHHYMIVSWESHMYVDGSWTVGIAAMPSKKAARKAAGGYGDLGYKLVGMTNKGAMASAAWFVRQLDDIMHQTNATWGPSMWEAVAINPQRHRVYRWILAKRGWTEDASKSYMYTWA